MNLNQFPSSRAFWQPRIPSIAQASTAIVVFVIAMVLSWASFLQPAIAFPLSPTLAVDSLFSISGDRPTNLGIANGSLASCPASPNCVTSTSPDPAHRIAPLPLNSAPETAISTLKTIIQNQPRTKIITETDDYLYAEFTSFLMGFVDDVEFYVDPVENVIQVRSASRLGESDLGVNRKRIDTIRTQFNNLNPA
jgi:uncharacterized protein (DUF1499 family)